ncbi:MAG: SLBB domain-containing protein, partial [Armatimonadetes bacterium]|nr:SLBB domain-containing protein [Armatimonadota bacterium]
IHAGDTLAIVVANHPELSLPSVVVPADGTIVHPLGQRVKVAGKTVQQVTDELLALLRKELRYPAVTVRVTAATPQRVFVVGEVRNPGPYDLTALGLEGIDVLSLIGMAGGYTAKADGSFVTVVRQGQEPREYRTDSPELQALKLTAGDTLIVPERVTAVTVLGEVVRPGRYLLSREDTLVSVLAQAGGPTPNADLKRAVLVHADGTQQDLDLAALLSGTADTSKLPKPQNGDTIILPAGQNNVVVLGEVLQPGKVSLGPGMTLVDALAERGGPTPRADLKHALLVHPDGTQNTVDLSGLLDGTLDVRKLPKPKGGDALVLMQARRDVVVLGEVVSPQRLTLEHKMTVLDALAAAGGPTKQADLQRVQVTDRDGKQRIISLINDKGQLAPTSPDQVIELSGGETITVPREPMVMVTVLGFVQRPGKVEIKKGERVADAISQAGGWIQGQAKPQGTMVLRPGPEGQQAEMVKCDMTKVLQGQRMEMNLVLRDGDVVYVPGSTDHGENLRFLTRILGLAAVFSRL